MNLTVLDLGDVGDFYWLLWRLVLGSYSKIHPSSPVMTLKSKFGSVWWCPETPASRVPSDYHSVTLALTKRLEKKLDGNYTRMLRAILNRSWQQHPTRCQLYGHLPPITKSIQARRTRHAGHCWRSKDEIVSDVLLWTPAYGQSKAGRPSRTFIQQLCDDTGCNPEDLPEAMNDRETWRERVRDIRAGRTSWWWWWWWALAPFFPKSPVIILPARCWPQSCLLKASRSWSHFSPPTSLWTSYFTQKQVCIIWRYLHTFVEAF